MNEKLQSIYDLYKQQGLIKDATLEQFAAATPEQQQALFDLGAERGLFMEAGSDQFKEIFPNQPPTIWENIVTKAKSLFADDKEEEAAALKKKEVQGSTESPSAGSSLASPSSLETGTQINTQPQATNFFSDLLNSITPELIDEDEDDIEDKLGKKLTPYGVKVEQDKRFREAIKLSVGEEGKPDYKEISVPVDNFFGDNDKKSAIDLKKWLAENTNQEKIAEQEAVSREFQRATVNEQAFNKALGGINADLISQDEESIVPQLTAMFGNYGIGDNKFKFEEVGATDNIKVTAPNGKVFVTEVDAFTSKGDEKIAADLKKFMDENKPALLKAEDNLNKYATTFLSEQEMEEATKSFSLESENFKNDVNSALYEKKILEAGKNKMSSEEYNQRKQALNEKIAGISEKEVQLNSNKLMLDKSLAKYVEWKSEQGGVLSSVVSSLVGGYEDIAGGALNTFKDAMISIAPVEFSVGAQDYRQRFLQSSFDIGVEVPYDIMDLNKFKMSATDEAKFNNWVESLPEDVRDKVNDKIKDDVKKKMRKEVITPSTDVIGKGYRELVGTSPEYIEKAQKTTVLQSGLMGVAGSLPAMTGGKYGTIAQFALMGLNGTMDEMSGEQFENISENEKYLVAMPVAILNGVLEEYGLRNMIGKSGVTTKILTNVMGKVGNKATASTFKEFVENEVESQLSRGLLTLGAAGLAEAETGGMQQLGELTIKEIYNQAKEKELFQTPDGISGWVDEIAESAKQEAVGGIIMGSIGAVSTAATDNNYNGISDETLQKIEALRDDETIRKAYVANLKYDIASGKKTKEQAQAELDGYNKSISIYNQIPTDLSNAAKRKAYGLLKEKSVLEASIQGKDASLVKKQNERINEIKNELAKLPELRDEGVQEASYSINGEQMSEQDFTNAISEMSDEDIKTADIKATNATEGVTSLLQDVARRSGVDSAPMMETTAPQEKAELSSNKKMGELSTELQNEIDDSGLISQGPIGDMAENKSVVEAIDNKIGALELLLERENAQQNPDANVVNENTEAINKLNDLKAKVEQENLAVSPAEAAAVETVAKAKDAAKNKTTKKTKTFDEYSDELKSNFQDLLSNEEGDLKSEEEYIAERQEKRKEKGVLGRLMSSKPSTRYIDDIKSRIKMLKNNPEQYIKDEIKKYEEYKTKQGENFDAEGYLNFLKETQSKLQEENAVQESTTEEGVLRTEQPQVGLPTVGQGNTQQATTQEGVAPAKTQEVKPIEQELSELEQMFPTEGPTGENRGVAASNNQAMDEMASRATDERVKKVIKTAQRLTKTLKSLFPTADINLHETEDSYNGAMEEMNGVKGSNGNFAFGIDANGKPFVRIDINTSSATSTDVAHEVAHAVLQKTFGDNQKLFKSFQEKIAKVLSTEKNQRLLDFANNPAYQQQGVTYEEYMAELKAILSEEGAKIELSTAKKIAAVINEYVSRITKGAFKPFQEVTDVKQVVDFVNKVTEAMAKGEAIDINALDEGVSTNIGDPTNINPDIRSRASLGAKLKFPQQAGPLSFVTEKDKVDFKKLIDEIIDSNKKVWFWMADQLGRGDYYDSVIDGNHYLDAGPSFALDPKNRSKKVLWASGLSKKTLEKQIKNSDYIFFISGSPEKAKLFNKQVLNLIASRINKNSDFNKFKEAINSFGKETNELKAIKNALEKVNSFEELSNSSKRKEFLIAIDKIGKLKTMPEGSLKALLNSFDVFVDYNELRDSFYRENGFEANDVMLIGKPTGVGGKAAHSTYENEILGEVIGVPDVKVDSWNLMPDSLKKKYKKAISGKEEKTKSLQTKVIAAEIGQVRKLPKELKSRSSLRQEEREITMPDGTKETVKPVSPKIVDGFYSPLEKSILSLKASKWGSGQQVLNELKKAGAKPDELKWTGIQDWLSQQGKVSKDDILNFLDENRVEILEVVKSDKSVAERRKELIDFQNQLEEQGDYAGMEAIERQIEDLSDDSMGKEATKYSQYQLEGEYNNYKEVLVTLPSKAPKLSFNEWAKEYYGDISDLTDSQLKLAKDQYEKSLKNDFTKAGNQATNKVNFKSSHWDEPNIAVHLRMNTRTDSEGNKVLFLEELQSDWGQEGKKQGFAKPENTQEIKELENEKQKVLDSSKSYQLLNNKTKGNLSVNVFNAIQQTATNMIDNSYSTDESRKKRFLDDIETTISYWGKNDKYAVPKMNKKELSNFYDIYIQELENNSVKISGYSPYYLLSSLENKIREIDEKIFDFSAKKGISQAPFVTDTKAWTKLGLKTAIKEAIKQRVDRIAWTTGEQQAKRYDLSKQVDEIRYNPQEKILRVKDIEGTQSVLENVSEKQIEDYIGKEAAKNLIDAESDKNGLKVIKGEGLKVGGSGMKGFYDNIVPSAAKSLIKEITGKEGFIIETSIMIGKNTSSNQQSFEITPDLKTKVEVEGMPMFSRSSLRTQTQVDDVVKQARASGYSEKAIEEFLKNRGVAQEKIDSALGKKEAGTKIVTNEEMMPGYDKMMSDVDEVILGGVNRGKMQQNILKDVLDSVRKSEAYKNATDQQREEIEREVKKAFGEKMKSAPSPNKLLGLSQNIKNITMALSKYHQQRYEDMEKAEANKEKAIKKASKELVASLKYLVRKGQISTKQMATVLRKFVKTNVLSKSSVKEFTDYMTKVFNDAEYANKLSEANKLKKIISRASKNKSNVYDANLVKLAEQFKKIDPSMVDNIDQYIKMASELKEAIRGTTAVKGKVRFANTVKISDFNDYVNTTMESQKEKIMEQLRQQVQDLLGIDASTLSYEELIDKLNETGNVSLSKENEEAVRGAVEDMFKVYSDAINSMLSSEDVDIKESKIELVKRFMKMDISKMKIKDAIYAVDALNNFMVNGSTAKMEKVLNEYEGQRAGEVLLEKNIKADVPKIYRTTKGANYLIRYFQTVPMMIENFFKGSKSIFFEKVTGIRDLISHKSQAQRIVNVIIKDYTDTFYKLKPNGQKFNTAFNNIERSMLAYVSRAKAGKEGKSFKDRKSLIEQSIENLRTGTEAQQKKADLYQQVYDKILKDSKSSEEVRGKVDPINADAFDYWVDKWANFYDELADVSENIHNKILGKDIFYTPDKVSKLKSETKNELGEMTGSAFHTNSGVVYKKKTGRLEESTLENKLPEDSYIDLSFDNNNASLLLDALVDIKTAGDVAKLNAFLKSDSFKKIFPNAEIREIFVSRMDTMIRNFRGKNHFQDDDSRKLNKFINRTGGLSSAIALTSGFQLLKQTISVATGTLFNAGRPHLGYYFNKAKRDFINNSGEAIANRGTESQADINAIDSLVSQAAESTGEKALQFIEKANKIYLNMFLKTPDVFIAQASWFAYYEKGLKRQGIKTKNIDYSKHELNKEAAQYAQKMVDRQQNISDADLKGEFFSSDKTGNVLLSKVLFPLASFRINAWSRMNLDLRTIANKTASFEDRKDAIFSLMGGVAEAAVFNKIGIAATGYMYGLAMGMIRGDDDDDEDKQKQRERDEKYADSILRGRLSQFTNDLISPIPLTDWLAETAVFETIDLIQELKGVKEDKRLNIFEPPDIDEPQKMTKYLGAFGISIERLNESKNIIKAAITGKIVEKKFGEETVRYVNPKDKEVLSTVAKLAVLNGLGLLPADANTIQRNIFREIKKQASTKTEAELIQEKAYKREKRADNVEKLQIIDQAIGKATDQNVVNELLKMKEETRDKLYPKKKVSDDVKEALKAKKKREKAEYESLLGGYESKDDLERYNPNLYEQNFGKNSYYYQTHKAEMEARKLIKDSRKNYKDRMYNYQAPPKKNKRKKNKDGSLKKMRFSSFIKS
jgi:hypothetical protein